MSTRLEMAWTELGVEALLLSPFAGLYALGWRGYRAIYDLGLKRAARPHRPVVCVGNLVAGGAGKTPVTLFVADELRDMGRDVVVGASGYGAPRSRAASRAPEGELDAAEWGDEPAMMRWLDPDLPLIVGRDRVRAAEIAAADFPGHVLLMDDGFQHLRVHIDVSIVLEPENLPNRLCLPAGPYREPRRSGRRRAGLVLPGEGFDYGPTHLYLAHPDLTPAEPPAGDVNVVTALARPYRFVQTVTALGMTVAKGRILPDHDPLDQPGLFDGFDPSLPIMVTAKDWVKLRRRPDTVGRPFIIAWYDAQITPADAFRAWLSQRLDETDAEEAR